MEKVFSDKTEEGIRLIWMQFDPEKTAEGVRLLREAADAGDVAVTPLTLPTIGRV